MRTMIVGKNLAFGAGLDAVLTKDAVNVLTDGALTLSRSDTNAVLKAGGAGDLVFATAFAEGTKVQFVQGCNGYTLLSPMIEPKTLVWNKQAYAAAVAKIVHVGRNASALTWTLPNPANHVGEYAQIRITDKSMPTGQTNNMVIAEYLIKNGDDATAVHNGLFAVLEKYKGKFYANVEKNVSSTNLGYKFTGIVGKDFTVHPELLLAGSPITVATPFNGGRGKGAQLIAEERLSATHKGYNPADSAPEGLNDMDFFIDPAANYDVFALTWTMPNVHYIAAGTDPLIQQLRICVPTGQAIATHVEKVLLAVKNNTALWAPGL
jgi:hypothetical protein